MPDFHLADESSQPESPKPAAPKPNPGPKSDLIPVKTESFRLPETPGDEPLVPPRVPQPARRPVAPKPLPTVVLEEQNPGQADAASVSRGGPTDGFSEALLQFGSNVRGFLDALESPLIWLMRVAFPVGALCLAYLLAATFMGGVANFGRLSPSKGAELLRNFLIASQALKFCLIVGGVSMLLLAYDNNKLGAATVAAGLFLYFGLPFALHRMVGVNPATALIAHHLGSAGYALVMIGLVKGVFDLGLFLWSLPDKVKERNASIGANRGVEAKQRKIAQNANMFSPCWNLPFCREAIRLKCPAFLARKTCWKFGRGCYCDEEMISRIVRGAPIEAIKAPTKMSQTKKPPCGRCYIYLEHQTYKFRMLSPLVLPGAVVLSYFLWPLYTKIFTIFDKTITSITSTISFSPTNLTPDAIKASGDSVSQASQYGTSPEQIAYIAQNLVGVLLGFFLLIYLSKLVEWAIFKAKL